MKNDPDNIEIGLDIGSTTAKVVVMSPDNRILWKDYRRHNAKQLALSLDYLREIETRFPHAGVSLFTTGSGGRPVSQTVGGIHVQEVNAVTMAAQKQYPRVGSVVELGGQDSKVIFWKRDRRGRTTSTSYMNDKCAGGTGATLDKIFSRIDLDPARIASVRAEGNTIHHIAAKCGVFAETDVVGLLKAGIPPEEIIVSLCSAIVKQNIEVLLHGHVLPDEVLLLGGPHTFFSAFTDIWRIEVPGIWKLHRFTPGHRRIEDLVYVPENAQYFAALGAVWFGRESGELFHHGRSRPEYRGAEALEVLLQQSREDRMKSIGGVRSGLVTSREEVKTFSKRYAIPPFQPPSHEKNAVVDTFLGLDGGSTSSKIALIDRNGELLYRDYVLSRGNPIIDAISLFERIADYEHSSALSFRILGTGVTGYAAEILKKAFRMDTAVVETVAHLKSARQYYGDPDVICDVGGQDIKVMFMKHGRVVDIKLNTQCSAGNGYFLQSMANQFNVPMEEFAQRAFAATQAPVFNYGCAVFMEQDKVNFQQLGWSENEIMAGLALVLPQNIWNYVVQETNLSRLGKRFLLQGGTQRNLAAVKAQVDFIQERIPDARVDVHQYADVAGAIGAALEAIAIAEDQCDTHFIGLTAAQQVTFTSTNNDTTRCRFCANRCTRTYIDIISSDVAPIRHISGAGCDRGLWETPREMQQAETRKQEAALNAPNLVALAERAVFSPWDFTPVPASLFRREAKETRGNIVVGIPRLLNLFFYAPFFYTYFRSLGVKDVVYSDQTSRKLWQEGNTWGSIDPCFPAKVAPAHVFNLMKRKEITHICFPMITCLDSPLDSTLGNNACVIQMGTPEVVDAAFTRGRNHFSDAEVSFWKPLVRMDRKSEAQEQLYFYFRDILNISREESDFAATQGFAAMDGYLNTLREQGARVISRLVEEDRLGILLIGHPYHHDTGLNHGILDEFQACGFPILCIESLPITAQFLDPLFETDRSEALTIGDVWRRNFNRNTNLKMWAAKIASRHPNLAVVDMSSFKCGHDAPTYSYVDRILDASETPHFLFHDLDQNKPSGTINIRIQSIRYFLNEEQARLRRAVRGKRSA